MAAMGDEASHASGGFAASPAGTASRGSGPKAKAKAKGPAQAKPHVSPVTTESLSEYVHHASEEMQEHKNTIVDLKNRRAAAAAEKRVVSQRIRKVKQNHAKRDKVMAKRSTWSLVAELEKRVAADKKKEAKGA